VTARPPLEHQRKAWRSAQRHALLPPGRIALAVQYMTAAGGWAVACSLYGADVSPLSAWPTRLEALEALERYRTAGADLVAVVAADESRPDYIDPRHPFTAAELGEIAAALAAALTDAAP
jgi:hypothetical protein